MDIEEAEVQEFFLDNLFTKKARDQFEEESSNADGQEICPEYIDTI